jgi:purine-binding chemotaxis protein CheW
VQLVVVTIGPDEYAIPIERVQEVVRYMRPRPLPHSDANVLGVIDLRGRVLPLVSARASFGLADEDLPEDAKVAVINIGDTRVGLVVDDVIEVLGAPRSLIVPPPERAGTRALEAVEAVARLEDRLLVVLNAEALLEPVTRTLDRGLLEGAVAAAGEEAIAAPQAEASPDLAEPPSGTHAPAAEDAPAPQEPAPGPPPEQPSSAEPPSAPASDAAESPAPREPGPSPAGEPLEGAIPSGDVVLVRAVYAMAEPHEEKAIATYAKRLAEVSPELAARLGLSDPASARRLLAAVRLAVRGLDRIDDLLPAFASLGVRIDGRTASASDIRAAIEASAWALRRGLGKRFDAGMERAWTTSAWTLVAALIRAEGGG